MISHAANVRQAAWVLLGGILGTAMCIVAASGPWEFVPVDPVAFASLSVFAMLVRTVRHGAPCPLAEANLRNAAEVRVETRA